MTVRVRYGRELFGVALFITGMLAICLLLVPPTLNVPLNDDWAYAQSVQHLLATGQLRVSNWATAALIPQVYWGAAFTQFAGSFSFVTLRLSTILFSLVTALALYDLLRQLDLSWMTALLGVLVLIANPLFLNLTYSFMTDIFYLGLMLISLTLYARGLKGQPGAWLVAGSIFAALAYLERQIGVVLPLAAALALLINRSRGMGRKLLLVSAIPAVTVVAHQLWMNATHSMPWAMQFVAASSGLSWLLNLDAIWTIALRAAWALLYLGLYTLPLLIALWITYRPQRTFDTRWRKFFGLWLIVLAIPVAVVVMATRQSMPFLANIINAGGLGALTLPGARQPQLPTWLFWLITIAAPIAGAAYAAIWTQVIIIFRRLSASELVTLSSGIGVGVLSVIYVMFWDRYLLALLPASIFILLRGHTLTRTGWISGAALCGVVAFFSLLGVRDYFTWNAARWSAAQHLVEQGVPPTAIDGGVEWVGWHDFEAALAQVRSAGRADTLLSWMNATPKLYRLAFEPLAGYDVVGEVAYPRLLSDRPDRIYVLQRP